MKLHFTSDYMEGAAPEILRKISEINLNKHSGYGTDEICENARNLIRKTAKAPDADVFFVSGGTQANAIVIDSVLRPYQGVIAATTGHVSGHEAGAIEYGGHKVLTIPQKDGKISAEEVEKCVEGYRQDENHDHMVMPGMVYISQPTEYGTLYSAEELKKLSEVCHRYDIPLYMDGARLAYALTKECRANDVDLPLIAECTDVFTIGGTKCGALFGEAIVIPKSGFIPHLFTMIKQHGALLAKGFLMGAEYEVFFRDDLYLRIGDSALIFANRIREALDKKGYRQVVASPTNQIFVELTNEEYESLSEKVDMGFWEKPDDTHTVVRLATSFATEEKDVDAFISILEENK